MCVNYFGFCIETKSSRTNMCEIANVVRSKVTSNIFVEQFVAVIFLSIFLFLEVQIEVVSHVTILSHNLYFEKYEISSYRKFRKLIIHRNIIIMFCFHFLYQNLLISYNKSSNLHKNRLGNQIKRHFQWR